MIIEAIKGNNQDNVEVLDSVKMTIDEEATVFLLQSISENLYKRPERAILQELGSNAFDSHIRAFQKRPFEVTLPSALNPVLIVQDWGVGMSKQDIKKMFSKVGGSDKRGTNAERGGYGLGSKSPLAITPSFSLITVKDGEKHTIAVIRDEDGIPDFKFVDYEKTDEANGVTVCVPVHNIRAMQTAAENLYITYPQDSVLINGRAPEYSLHNPRQFQRIGKHGWYALDTDAVSHFNEASGEILGVRYAITPDLDGGIVSRLDNANRVFLSLPNGLVKVETSREGIRDVSQSREHVTRVATAWTKEFRSQAERRLRESERLDALIYHRTLPKFLREELSMWNGEELPQNGVPLFPVQKRELENADGTPSGRHEVLKSDDPRFVKPPYTARIEQHGRAARYKATPVTNNGDEHPAPSRRGILTVVYVLPDADLKTVRNAARDIYDYERSLLRAGVQCGEKEVRYISVASPDAFSPWFREVAQFVPIENIAEAAFAERQEVRRAAKARRKQDTPSRSQREKHDYNVLAPRLTSSSERARLAFETMNSEMLTAWAKAADADGVNQEAVIANRKVAYVVPNAAEESLSAARFITKLADRAEHPGRKTAGLARTLVELLDTEGYKVVALRASQKPEDLISDIPGALHINEAVDAVLALAVGRLTQEADTLSLWTQEKSSRIMRALDGRIGELKDPMFLAGRAKPTGASKAFLQLLRHGAYKSNYRSDRENYSDAVRSNILLLGLEKEQSAAVLSAHDKITEPILLANYPLLTAAVGDRAALDHAIFYANALYERNVEEQC